jgi:hypothetical protein
VFAQSQHSRRRIMAACRPGGSDTGNCNSRDAGPTPVPSARRVVYLCLAIVNDLVRRTQSSPGSPMVTSSPASQTDSMPTFCDKPRGFHTTYCDTNMPDLPATPLLRILALREGGGKDHAKEHSVAFFTYALIRFHPPCLSLILLTAA